VGTHLGCILNEKVVTVCELERATSKLGLWETDLIVLFFFTKDSDQTPKFADEKSQQSHHSQHLQKQCPQAVFSVPKNKLNDVEPCDFLLSTCNKPISSLVFLKKFCL